ncbi:nitrate/nitrite transporter NrtS [Psychrosphaera sp. B3R10]|uniref:nitrate/nitrite transporter NrtS n=1 Tax=unclassified Psychrosphaera TaxID=2641570 RepID=UPI001C085F53|nr:nitrate/nitrite transporter NrtS [Psychrosphaera sp. 1_MG-2023]MBU2883934.1 nitrate/nitrite transporter NrtS [Psychrosphaera sp. I2R16]MBU2990129.1 nitrate/nitrite transporter NrtS [Psychrosphaera sp. B3R10]MDO6719905.1 nitrate/nitrite transporter NrtS [Psychrosphaera sp. 1_MG-2023]
MSNVPSSFISLALSKKVAYSALKVSILVGTLLALINHGGALLEMNMSADRIIQILLTYLVPYCVSTFSAVKAIQQYEKTH